MTKTIEEKIVTFLARHRFNYGWGGGVSKKVAADGTPHYIMTMVAPNGTEVEADMYFNERIKCNERRLCSAAHEMIREADCYVNGVDADWWFKKDNQMCNYC